MEVVVKFESALLAKSVTSPTKFQFVLEPLSCFIYKSGVPERMYKEPCTASLATEVGSSVSPVIIVTLLSLNLRIFFRIFTAKPLKIAALILNS